MTARQIPSSQRVPGLHSVMPAPQRRNSGKVSGCSQREPTQSSPATQSALRVQKLPTSRSGMQLPWQVASGAQPGLAAVGTIPQGA